LLAYIDLQSARVHTIRSDGQQDTPIQLALLKTSADANWQSTVGQIILSSLAWSPDSSMLAFVADPTGSGQTGLYLAMPGTDSARAIATDLKGSFAHLAWSPDGTRLAFTLSHNGSVSVQDYNVQSRSALDLSNLPAAQGNDVDGVLDLNWFSNAGQVAVTWCLGSIGHISRIWVHRVGASSTIYPQQLLSGEYLQALYSPGGNNEAGGWLLVASVAGQAGDIWRLDLTTGSQPIRLSQNKQVNFVRWSPDGSSVFYLDNVDNGMGNGHLVNVITGSDQLLPDQIAISPMPDWSADGLQLAYSTGTQIDVVHTLNGGQLIHPHLRGQITSLSWSSSAIHQLIISLGSLNPGLYLVDTQQNVTRQLDSVGTTSVIQWTEIP
jgi:Tol biopolymer transport system component